MKLNKAELLEGVSKYINDQLSELKQEVVSIQEEMGKETKSSAGDKFETAREMMNQERGRLEERIALLMDNLRAIEAMKDLGELSKIGFGALVKTDVALFLMGAALGKVEVRRQPIFILSLNSPIGKAFEGKEAGMELQFMNKSYNIISVD